MYVATGAIIFLMAFACKFSRLNADKIFLFFAAVVLFLLSAMRDPVVGSDLQNYIVMYKSVGEIPLIDFLKIRDIRINHPEVGNFETGYLFLCKILTCISKDPGFFIMITSLIIVGGAFFQIYVFSKNYYLSIFIYLMFGQYFTGFTAIRQSIAMAILGMATYYLTKNKIIYYFIFVALAVCIHKTALCFFILYPLSKLKVNKKYIILVLIGGGVLYNFGDTMLVFAARIFNYSYYINMIGHGNADGLFFMVAMVYCATIFFWKQYKTADSNADIWVHMLTGNFLLSVLSMHMGIMNRAVLYFSFYVSILVPNVIHSLKKENRVWGYSVVIMAMIFYSTYYLYRLDDLNSKVIPYVLRK